jgi:hypothetical protein
MPPVSARRRARVVGYFVAAVLIGLTDHWLSCATLPNSAGKSGSEATEPAD